MSFRRWPRGISGSIPDQVVVPFRDDAGEIKMESISENDDPLDQINHPAPIPIDDVVLQDSTGGFVVVNGTSPSRLSQIRGVGSFGLHDLDSTRAIHSNGVRLDWENLSITVCFFY